VAGRLAGSPQYFLSGCPIAQVEISPSFSEQLAAVEQAREQFEAALKLVSFAQEALKCTSANTRCFSRAGRPHHPRNAMWLSLKPCGESPRRLCQDIHSVQAGDGTLLEKNNIEMSSPLERSTPRWTV